MFSLSDGLRMGHFALSNRSSSYYNSYMCSARRLTFVCLSLVLLSPLSKAQAQSNGIDEAAVAWAYGTIVDSVTVIGNTKTQGYVILREMETQPGDVLNETDLARDVHFITGMSPIASAHVRADSSALMGHCVLRVYVEERAAILVGSILPQFKYNFDTGLNYGIRWSEKNFRGRLENLGFNYLRNERGDDNVSFGWSTPWIGWRHISAGVWTSYHKRGDVPNDIQVLESFVYGGFVALPLTESRIRFSQLTMSMSFERTRKGAIGEPPINERIIAPSIGHNFDSRDSHVRPSTGYNAFTNIRANYPTNGISNPFYTFRSIFRRFFPLHKRTVLATYSNLTYQFGDFPTYSEFSLGGPGSLRGYPSGRFKGFQRWFGTIELRYSLLPTRVFKVPVIKSFDMGLGVIGFMDSGIVWHESSELDANRLHGTGGVGIRLYNPIRDVLRVDWGFSLTGASRVDIATGIRF